MSSAARLSTGQHRRRAHVVLFSMMTVLAVFFLFPIVFMIVSSLKPSDQIFEDLDSGLPAFLPSGEISLDNYRGVFDRVPVWRFLANTAFVSCCTVVLGLLVNSMAGFALSRMRFRGRTLVLGLVIATLIIPFETIAVPLLFEATKLPSLRFDGLVPSFHQGWLNTYYVQIIPFVAHSFSIFLFRQYFLSIPRELDEAALVDGATWFGIYRRVIVPLSGPAFASAAIITFLPAWNQYLWPLLATFDEDVRPLSVGMDYFFQLRVAWGEVMAFASIVTIPVVCVFVAFQRVFVSSIAAQGVKG